MSDESTRGHWWDSENSAVPRGTDMDEILVFQDDNERMGGQCSPPLSFLRSIGRLETEHFIGHVRYSLHADILDASKLHVIGYASHFAQSTWHWPEQVMRVTLQQVSPTVAVSSGLRVDTAVQGRGYSRTFFGFYAGVARLLGVTTLMAFVKATNEIQLNRLTALGWDDLGNYGRERVEEGECVRPRMLRKEL